MDTRQRQLFYEHTGFQEFESYVDSLIEKGMSIIDLGHSAYKLWESGFATYCMENYEFEPSVGGIKIKL